MTILSPTPEAGPALPIRRALTALALLLAILPAATAAARAEDLRIVALGGAVTETLYALGLGEAVVAVDTTSIEPPDALRTKPNVGYLRQLSAEGILSTRPGLVIAIDGAGPPDALKLVEAAGIRVAHVPDEPSAEGVHRKIVEIGRLVGREGEAAALAGRVRAGFASLAATRERLGPKVRTLFVLSLQNGRTMVGGSGTTADGMLALAGAENVAATVTGYKPMTDEAILAAAPDAVVMMAQGPGGEAKADSLGGPALSGTPAAAARRLVVMDGLYLLGFGPRTPEAVRDLMRGLHPGQSIE